MQKALTLLEEVISKQELDKFIMGKENYSTQDNFIETPTDITTIFIQGFNKYTIGHHKFLFEEITKALIKLTKDPIGLWWVTFFIYSYLFNYLEGSLFFHFDIDEVLENIMKNISPAEDILKNNKDFIGYRFSGGLWENTESMLNKINEKLQ